MLPLLAFAWQLITRVSADQVAQLTPAQAWQLCQANQVQAGAQVLITDTEVSAIAVDGYAIASCSYQRPITDPTDPCFDAGENATWDVVRSDGTAEHRESCLCTLCQQ